MTQFFHVTAETLRSIAEDAARSMRDRAAQEVLIDTHRAPMAISEAIAALPLLADTDRPDLADLPAEDLVEPGDEVPTLCELADRLHAVEERLGMTDGPAEPDLCPATSPGVAPIGLPYMCEGAAGHPGDHYALRGSVTWNAAAAALAKPAGGAE